MAKLLSSLPVGTSVVFGKHSINGETAQPIVWVVADKNHSGYPSNSVTLLAKRIIDLRAYDGLEVTGSSQYFGSSNIHQWLNSDAGAGAWYSATHTGDKPPTSTNTTNGTQYESLPGFLYNFAPAERNAILSTTLNVQVAGGTSNISTKVFLPSVKELGKSYIPTTSDSGSILAYFSTNPVTCSMTDQAFTYSLSNYKPSYAANNFSHWTRNCHAKADDDYVFVNDGGAISANAGHVGVRPMLNVSGNAEISDTPDADGNYTFSLTNAPSAPANVRVTTNPVYTTKPCTVAWDKSTDPNGDSVGYRVQLYYNGVASGTPIDVGTATSYTLAAVNSGVTSVGFGVDAYDARGHYSAAVSVTKTAITNNVPVISGSNSNIGIKSDEFTQSYTITDADNTNVTVTEYIDNVKIRSYVATLGASNTFAVTGNTWLKLANGIHTLKITATDGIDEATRTFTFTKTVNTLVVQRVTPLPSDTKPSRLVVTVVKSIPPEATFKVEACNNGFDTSPAWEDITSSINSGQTHVFANPSKTADKWGVNIRVTINRNGGAGACYITEIGGNFE